MAFRSAAASDTYTTYWEQPIKLVALQKMAIEKAKAGGGMRPSERRAQQMLQQGPGGYGDQPNGGGSYDGRGGGRGGYGGDYGNTRARPEPSAGGYQAAPQYGHHPACTAQTYDVDLPCPTTKLVTPLIANLCLMPGLHLLLLTMIKTEYSQAARAACYRHIAEVV